MVIPWRASRHQGEFAKVIQSPLSLSVGSTGPFVPVKIKKSVIELNGY
jgi:hypothetical protein